MSKTKEELNKIKEEVESVTRKIRELTDEELEQVTGGESFPPIDFNLSCRYRQRYKRCNYRYAFTKEEMPQADV